MNINPDTINQYKEEAESKIELLRQDIQTYQYRIKVSEKEIETLQWLIKSYNEALKKLEAM